MSNTHTHTHTFAGASTRLVSSRHSVFNDFLLFASCNTHVRIYTHNNTQALTTNRFLTALVFDVVIRFYLV